MQLKISCPIFIIILFSQSNLYSIVFVSIEGVVLDSLTNKPISNVTLFLDSKIDEPDSIFYGATTNNNGEYFIKDVIATDYNVLLKHQKYIQKNSTISLSKNKNTTGLRFFLIKGSLIIGKVIDSESKNPLEKMDVSGPNFDGGITNENGIFEVFIPFGDQKIFVSKGNFFEFISFSLTIPFNDTITIPDIKIEARGIIAGKVEDLGGNPVKGIQISAIKKTSNNQIEYFLSEAPNGEPDTENSGKFLISGVKTGLVYFRINNEDNNFFSILDSVEVIPFQTSTIGVIVADPLNVLTGTIKVMKNGSLFVPEKGFVKIKDINRSTQIFRNFTKKVRLDENGFFEVFLRDGIYKFGYNIYEVGGLPLSGYFFKINHQLVEFNTSNNQENIDVIINLDD